MAINSYVINLQIHDERRKHIKQIFDTLVDKFSIEVSANYLSLGEIGCYLSHFCLWKKVVDENLDYIAIFEDDIYLAKDTSLLLKQLDWLPKDFDAVKLETMYEKILINKGIKILNERYLTKMKSRHMGGAGYILSKKGASK